MNFPNVLDTNCLTSKIKVKDVDDSNENSQGELIFCPPVYMRLPTLTLLTLLALLFSAVCTRCHFVMGERVDFYALKRLNAIPKYSGGVQGIQKEPHSEIIF